MPAPEPVRPHDLPGLSDADVAASRARHGANELTPPPRDPWWKLYLEKFNDPIIRILLVAAVIALGVGVLEGHYAEGVGILIAILLATTLAFVNEFKAGKEFDLLNRVRDDVAVRVRRGGANATVPRRDLVVGDVVLLENGEEVPADADVLDAVSVLVNESSLTGESAPVAKYPLTGADAAADAAAEGDARAADAAAEASRHAFPPNRLLRGTLLADGHAVARVTAVGDASEIGQTARAAAERTDLETPLKRQLEKLSKVIGVIGFSMAALVFATLVVRGAQHNTLGPRLLVPAASPDRADVTLTVALYPPLPDVPVVDPATGRTPLVGVLAVESTDPRFPGEDGFYLDPHTDRAWTGEILPSESAPTVGGGATIRLAEPAPFTIRLDELGPPADAESLRRVYVPIWRQDLGRIPPDYGAMRPVTVRIRGDLVRGDLTPGEWYFFAMLVAGGLLAMMPIWWPIVLDAMEFVGRRCAAPAWLCRPGGRTWLLSAGAGLAVFALMAFVGRRAGLLDATPADWFPLPTAEAFLHIFMIAVTIIVVAVPEGLPMSVTLSLAYAMRKMTATHNLVRRMHACETIGAATVICSDKTGTLTQNKMRVAETLFAGDPDRPDDDAFRPDALLAEALAVNATADLGPDPDAAPDDPNPGPDGGLIPLGNPTEGALLLWLHVKEKVDYQAVRAAFRTAGQLPFNTENKFMATAGRSGAAGGAPILFVKGAPEIVLGRCASERASFFAPPERAADGSFVLPAAPPPLADDRRARWLDRVRERQARGMRALGFAYRRLSEADLAADPATLARDLVWMGCCAIADPVRAEVPAAIEACREAGVRVKVVTGDNADTAREIARGIGLWTDADGDGEVITGEAFSALDDRAVGDVSERIKIMARARPLAKLRLVKTLQERGEVVAVTGDGTNDAPALNHADVGLAMGQTGTSTAKEAADIILLDDSFQSIVNAVRWGRSLYANIQKFILFQLTINVAALGIAVIGPFLGVGSPLTVTQMLWVNLIMDTFATLALASEPPNDAVMRVPPRKPSAFIVTPPMRKRIFGLGGLLLAAFIGVVAFGRTAFPLAAGTPEGLRNLTLFFNAFVFVQFWNLFNARAFQTGRSALARLGESGPFLAIAAVIALGQVAITQFGGSLFRVTPLSGTDWLAVIGGTSVVLWAGELARALVSGRGCKN